MLHNPDHGLIAYVIAALGVSDNAVLKEDDAVYQVGIHVQGAVLPGVSQHLHNSGQVHMSKAAGECSV